MKPNPTTKAESNRYTRWMDVGGLPILKGERTDDYSLITKYKKGKGQPRRDKTQVDGKYNGDLGISLLKTRKKVWCVLEESQCQLVYFKNEEDFQGNRCPLGSITLKGAAITLDLENHNQFIILCDGKEYIFTAENHESMMIWLLGLQAKRDVCGEEGDSSDGDEVMAHDRHRVRKRQNEVPLSTTSPVGMTADSVSRRKPNWQKYKHERMAESVDTGFTVYRSKGENEHLETSRSRSLPPVFEAMESPRISSSQSHTRICMSKSLDIQRRISKDSGTGSEIPRKYSGAGLDLPKIPSGTALDSYQRKHRSSRNGSVSSGDNSDDVFGEHLCKDPYGEHACSKPLYMEFAGASKEESRPTLDTIDSSASAVDFPEQSENKDVGSCSSVSVSSDSAIDRGETSSAEMASRLMDLEKELITTKCELAKVMNRQSGYEELLAQRDDAIRFLEGRLDTSTPPESSKGNSLKKSSKSSTTCKTDKELQERLRILQNQNRFLNQEVHKLAKLRQTDRGVFYQHEEKIRALEAEIEKWKLDYVSLIQSSIRFPGGDTMDDAELVLFGGDRHKIRVQRLLEEARSVNPSLPTYERLTQGEVHVDSYGFKHSFDGEDNGLLMHYLCQELTVHYLMLAGSYEQHQRKWTQFMRQHGKTIINHLKELKSLCRGGVPDRFRKHVWRQLVYGRVADIMEKRGQHYFRNLCNILPDSPLAACYRKQISLDLMRTMPSNTKFSTQGSKGVMDLQDVLLAYCVHNPTVGYCQGMNFIVGMALLFMDAHDAFWTLVAVTEHYFPSHYFDQNLIGAQADQQVLKDILADKLPNLYRHLEGIDIEISTVTLNWFLAIFFDAVPFQTLLRIWDCFLLEGPKVLFRFAMAILRIHERELLKKTDTISIMRHLKAAAKLTFDVDGLIKTAFEDLKPFPRRRDINTKQACYLNTLKEKHKKKELQKLAFTEREQLYMAMEAETGSDMTIGSAVVLEEGKAWLCYGSQSMAKVCKVTTEEGLMFDLNLEVDSRVMCMQKAGERVIVIGTISWMLQAYDSTTREGLWQMQLHDAVLSLYCYTDEEAYVTRTFAGLADGTVAVIEQLDVGKMSMNNDVMYVPVGQAPVACLLLVGENLWCASGNTVYIIHARTLDSVDNFNVSVNPYDHILSMVSGEFGIWISLRGSSILELWDPKSLNCKLLYDTRTDRYPQLRKEDDTYFNRSRITAIMDLGHTVWVGTGEGNLIIYEIQEHLNLKTPTDLSPSIESMMGVHSNARNRPRQSMAELRRLSASTPILNNDRASFSVGMEEIASPVMTPDKERRITKKTLAKLKMDFMSVKNNRLCSVTSETASTGTITPINVSPRIGGSEKQDSDLTVSTNHGNIDLAAGEEMIGEINDSDDSDTALDSSLADKNDSTTRRKNRKIRCKETRHKKVARTKALDNLTESGVSVPNGCTNRPKATRPTDLCVNGKIQNNQVRSPRKAKRNITNKEDFDMLIEQLNGVSQKFKTFQADHASDSTDEEEDKDSGEALKNGCNGMEGEKEQPEVCVDKKTEKSEDYVDNESGGQTPTLQDQGYLEPPAITSDEKAMSRHHKVNSWLSSISENFDTADELAEGEGNEQVSENTGMVSKQKSSDSDEMFFNASDGLPDSPVSNCSGKEEDKVKGTGSEKGRDEDSGKSDKCSSHSGSKTSPRRKESRTLEMMKRVLRRQRTADSEISVDSQDLDRRSSEGEADKKNISKSNDPEVKYRLEFSGMLVDTDVENEPRRRLSEMSFMANNNGSFDEGVCPPIDPKLIAQMSRMDNWSLNASSSDRSKASSDHKLLELMQTPSLMSRHISVGKVSRELISLTDLYGSNQSSASPRSSVDQRVAEFLRTPSLSSRASSKWSSYENISTPSVKDDDFDCIGRRFANLNSLLSQTSSSASLCSMADGLCYVELSLQAKVKIADKPVKGFVKTRNCGQPCILSFSGCYGDDEAVLKWRRDPNERLWTNEPILEICPKTKMTKLPTYMRGRLSSASSQTSSLSFRSTSSQPR